MNLDPLSFCLAQIGQLVEALTKKNLKQTGQELAQLVRSHGIEAEKQLVRCLVKEACRALSEGGGGSGGSGRSASGGAHASLLAQHLQTLLDHPARVSILCHAIDRPIPANPKVNKSTVAPFAQLFRALKLTAVQEVAFCLALRKSKATDVAVLANQHLKKRLVDLVQCYLDTDSGRQAEAGGLQDCSPEILQSILVLLLTENFGLPAVTKELFLKRMRREFPRNQVPVILAPLLYPDDSEFPLEEMTSSDEMAGTLMKNAIGDLVKELGYAFTASVEECKNNILNLGGGDVGSADVARIISTMVKNHSGLPDGPPLLTPGNFWIARDAKKDGAGAAHGPQDSWNVEVFVQALKDFPNVHWKDVILQLDHPEFAIKDRQGLYLLFSILRLGLQSFGLPSNSFPIEYIYRHWTNYEGQFSLVANVLKNPDIFNFADHFYIPVSIDILKSLPETDNKEIANWQSLNLVELLIFLSERGLYSPVQELFKVPIQNCPDVLLLALLQISMPVTLLRQELIATLIPTFLGNHPNSAIILHHAWHTQIPSIKPIIMHAMADWYLRGELDQSRLTRILDVAQDLKALSMLLNVQAFLFVIDLACLASRREYLKLDKWLSDKIRDHGEQFVLNVVKFLHRRCPQIIVGKISDEQLPKVTQLPPDTITTIIHCLSNCVGSVQPELAEMIMVITNNCSQLLNKNRQPVAAAPRAHRGIESFNPSAIGNQIFNSAGVDPIANLGSNLSNMSLGVSNNTSFTMPGSSLGALVTTPGSPSRLMPFVPSHSPFSMPFQHNVNMGNMMVSNKANAAVSADKRMNETQVLFPEIITLVTKDIEDEANGYFQRIYNHPPHPTLSIEEVLDMLKKFSESSIKRERDVYSCMLRNIFEEYRFFPQYPDKELHTTAQLFGGIIEKQLVSSYMALGLALKSVLEALKKPSGSKMFSFGLVALDRFKSRLKEFHKYCEHIRTIEHFYEFPPHLIEYVEYGLQGQEPPTKPQGQIYTNSFVPPTTPIAGGNVTSLYKPSVSTNPPTVPFVSKMASTHTTSRPSIANATNIDTLLVATDREEQITVPPDPVQDKIAFIFNNLSQLNLQPKCEELRDIIIDDYWPWLSQYLVMKRASIELNFHALYSNFLDVLKVKELCKMVTKETFRNIGVLLRSDKGIANFSDRSLLKNLGHWLGMLTLGRNRPILFIDLDVKGLILEAFHKGQQELLYVVPFVAKVLESCAKSKVFKPPNPWTMSIMNVLAELHQEPDLKLNLKFEIEVLCKNLSVDVANLTPASYLKDSDNLKKIQNQLSNPSKKENTSTPVSQTMGTPIPTSIIPSNLVPPDEVAGISVTPTSGILPGEAGMIPLTAHPEPRFNYLELNISNMSQFSQFININPQMLVFQNHPHLKQFVRSAIERSIQDWINPVVDRSIKYALPACEHIIRKDFALDPEESRMRMSAHHTMRHVTAGLALTNCRDQLQKAIIQNLTTSLFNVSNVPQKDILEAAATAIANDNMELVCVFIQKTSAEKGVPELDKRLISDYELRKTARLENRRYIDNAVLNYHNERMPERIRLKVGCVSEAQMTVYEEFARNIPGFAPNRERSTPLLVPKPVAQNALPMGGPFNPGLTTNHSAYYGSDEISKLISDIEQALETVAAMPNFALQSRNLRSLIDCLCYVRRDQDVISAFNLLQKAVEGLIEGLVSVAANNDIFEAMTRYKELHVRALKLLQESLLGQIWTSKHVTSCLTEGRDDLKFSNLEAVDCLIRANLVNIQQYEYALAQCMDGGSNYIAVAFAIQFVQLYLVNERDSILMTESDLVNTIETLVKILAHSRQPPEGLASLIKLLRADQDISNVLGDRPQIAPLLQMHMYHPRLRDDPHGLTEKTEYLLREWVTLFHNPPANREIMKTFNAIVQKMNAKGIFQTEDTISQFFRIATQLCIDNVYQLLEEDRVTSPENIQRNKLYHMTDAYVRLVTLLIKNSGDTSNTIPKINLLNKILNITAGCLLQDHKERGIAFQQLPYFRILIMLFLDLNESEPVLEAINFQLLTGYCHMLHMIQPIAAPGFIYGWLDFVAHRAFIHRMLASTPQQKGWGMYSQLLVDLFKYIKPFLTNTALAKPISLLYTGILKVLLVLLHDFPEFLCDYHYTFCDEISPNCIQMRNLVLSAFPRNMRLPDPFTPNLKFDSLVEIKHAPRILSNYAAMMPLNFKKDLDSYLEARSPVTFLSELRSTMQISNEPGKKYNVPLMNAVILYVGTQAINYIRSKGQTPSMTTIAHTAHMDIFQNLAVDLDYEGRYIFLNGIGNQLRFPNSHTHYFSCALLYLFAEANSEAIQEQITRMLLERIIVNRPHPWGLLVTFIELVKNPTYKFADHDFVHCAPEIEKLCTKENIQAIYTAKETNDRK